MEYSASVIGLVLAVLGLSLILEERVCKENVKIGEYWMDVVLVGSAERIFVCFVYGT